DRGSRLSTHTRDRCNGGKMRIAIIRHVVRRDHYVGVRLRNGQGIAATAAGKGEVACEASRSARRIWGSTYIVRTSTKRDGATRCHTTGIGDPASSRIAVQRERNCLPANRGRVGGERCCECD